MAGTGKVFLVGAGPGDPGLISVRGVECLGEADEVLYDGLVNPLLLRHTAAHAERTCRSEGPDGRTLRQHEINQRLIAAAREGKTVVRLKGGDPFIFGRGSEEAAALADAGIPFEVVPGITTATAAAEYAGISLTHRDFASSVAFITGHEDPERIGSRIDYRNLAAFSGTLVFYMGLHRLPHIVESLLAAGKPQETPACVISRATTPAQRTVSAPLGQLPQHVAAAKLRAPSLIIVGDCVQQRDRIAWFEKRPLFGVRIGICREIEQADAAIHQCLQLGAEPVLLPAIRILPPVDWTAVDAAIEQINEYEWIVFTSANGVDALWNRMWHNRRDARCLANVKLAAIGPATAGALARIHLRCDLIPDEFRAEALAAALTPHTADRRVLWPRASRGRDVLPAQLRSAGAIVDELVVYRNEDVDKIRRCPVGITESFDLDWLALSSPSIARRMARAMDEQPGFDRLSDRRIRIACISPVTAQAAREAGLTVDAVATNSTWPGLFDAIASA